VGNGEDAPPPGHDDNFNDGPGTGPGHPGAQGGNGIGHRLTAPTPLFLSDLPQRRQIHAAAAERSMGGDHGNAGGNGHGNGHDTAQLAAPSAPTTDAPLANSDGSQSTASAASASSNVPRDPPQDQLQALIASWFAQAGENGPSLSHYADIQEGVLRDAPAQADDAAQRNAAQWSSLNAYLAQHRHQYDDVGLDLAGAWLRDAGGLMVGALASGSVGLALPPGQELKVLKGLSEGLAKLG